MSKLNTEQERFKFISETYDAETFIVTNFSGSEGVSRLYNFEITLITRLPSLSQDEYERLDFAEQKHYICTEFILKHPAVFAIKHNDVLLNANENDYESEIYSSDDATYPILYNALAGSFKDTRNTFFYGYPSSCAVKEQVKQIGKDGENVLWTVYTICLRPAIYSLSRTPYNTIFTAKNLEAITKEILNSHDGIKPAFSFDVSGSALSDLQDFSFQYNESHFDYLSAKLEHIGLYYFYSRDSKKEEIIVQDDLNKYLDVNLLDGEALCLAYQELLSGNDMGEYVHDYTEERIPTAQSVFVRDYDWKNPHTFLEASALVCPSGVGEVYYYGEGFNTDSEARKIAKIRAEELLCQTCVYHGKSFVPTLRSGYCFTLKDHYIKRFNGMRYFITEIFHEGSQESAVYSSLSIPLSSSTNKEEISYQNSFKAILATTQFRPKRVTQRPKVTGLITGFIGALSDDASTVDTDTDGRYKVIFPQNTKLSAKDSVSSPACMVRRVLPTIGIKSGASFPLYPGVEVSIGFLDGNPDKPFITGSVNNTETSFAGQNCDGFSNLATGEISLSDNTLNLLNGGVGTILTSSLAAVSTAENFTSISGALSASLAGLTTSSSSSYYAYYGINSNTEKLVFKLAGPAAMSAGKGLSENANTSPACDFLGFYYETLGSILPLVATIDLKIDAHKGQEAGYGIGFSNSLESSGVGFEGDLGIASFTMIISSMVAHIASLGIYAAAGGIKEYNEKDNEEDNKESATDKNEEQGNKESSPIKDEMEKVMLIARAVVPSLCEVLSEVLALSILIYIKTRQSKYPRGGIRVHSSDNNVAIAAAKEARLVSDRQVFIGANTQLKDNVASSSAAQLQTLDSPYWGSEGPFMVAGFTMTNNPIYEPRVGIKSNHVFSGAQKVNRLLSLDEISISSGKNIDIAMQKGHAILRDSYDFIHYPNDADIAFVQNDFPKATINMTTQANADPILKIEADQSDLVRNSLTMENGLTNLKHEERADKKSSLDLRTNYIELSCQDEAESSIILNNSSVRMYFDGASKIELVNTQQQQDITLDAGNNNARANFSATGDITFNNSASFEVIARDIDIAARTRLELVGGNLRLEMDNAAIALTGAGINVRLTAANLLLF